MIRPRDVYSHATKERVKAYLRRQGWKVIGFRRPRAGEYYLGATGGDYILRIPMSCTVYDEERLVLQKI